MSTNPNYKPSEGKREEFRKYLEKNGVMDALTKVLVSLYEEVDKPQDALAFIRDKLAIQAGLETYDQMTQKIQEVEAKVKELEDQINELTTEAPPPDEQPPEMNETEDASVVKEEDEAQPQAPVSEENPDEVPSNAPPEPAPAT